MKPKELTKYSLLLFPILLLILITHARMAHADSHFPIYLDYATTAPMDPLVLKTMKPYLSTIRHMSNPTFSHQFEETAKYGMERARRQIAELIYAKPEQIIFTSGATEANNMALKGSAYFYQHKGKHIITSCIEHLSVLKSCEFLQNQGFQVTYIPPQSDGTIKPEDIQNAITPNTTLISIMHVNNETGAIQPIQAIGQIAKSHKIAFHVDAAQSVGKIPINVNELQVDFLSLSAHKIYGPKGIGAIYIREQNNFIPLMHGEYQEYGMRAGTLATHQIVGMGTAYALAKTHMKKDMTHNRRLKQIFWQALQKIKGTKLNGSLEHSVPNILNVTFTKNLNDPVIFQDKAIAVSTTSACSSGSHTPSYVLTAMGATENEAFHSVRFSFGRYTTERDIRNAIGVIQKQFQS